MVFVGNVCGGFFFCLFPTGHFAPRWTRWLLVVWIAYWGFTNLLLGSSNANTGIIGTLAFFGLLVSLAAIQVYRYRRVSTPMQRQQTKWVVYGLAVALVGFLFLVPVRFELSLHLDVIAEMLADGLPYLFLLLIPLSIGIAMLRSRLFDIDVITNRTLVYGSLTALLALVYFGLIIGLQSLLHGIISQDNSVAIVLSTLAIYVLFQPLRQGIQRLIDRRFYRRKYDAAKTIAAFSSTLRNEVDLAQLREQLIAVVQETMQPSHVSLWVRKPGRAEVPSLRVGKPPYEKANVHEEIAGHSV
jgi:divalent metal cation (Fe/Co/Zn/Cd) transporter